MSAQCSVPWRALACAMLLCASASVLAADGVKLPAFEASTLSNGAQIAFIEKRDTPLISMAVTLRGGALGDPAGKEGTASLFADLIQKGAGSRNATQFAEAIENVGGELSAGAGTEKLSIGATFLAKDADLMLELLADALQRPLLSAEEFAKARTLAIQSIVAAKDSDPRALIDVYGDAWLFRGHPYGRPVGGSESSLAGITLEDLHHFYAQHAGGDRLVIAVVGDFEANTMRRKLDTAFGGWRKAAVPAPPVPVPAHVKGRRVLLVDKPGATQAYFWMGNVGASRTDPARTEQSVVNTVFGGRFTSMLNTELRIRTGLTYGASASFDRGTQPGAFGISSYTQTETTVAAIDLALATLERLHEDGLDPATLESSKSYLLGQFPSTLETNGQLAARVADLLFYGLGPEDVDQFSDRVRGVDTGGVRRTIDSAFPAPANLALVLIGDSAKIRDATAKYGPVTEMKLTDPRFSPVVE